VTQVELQEAEQRVKKILTTSRTFEEEREIDPPPMTMEEATQYLKDVCAVIPAPVAGAAKQPRHVAVAINHLLAQRTKAIKVRDKAAEEVESLDAALLALGWGE